MDSADPRLNLPTREVAAPSGDFAIPSSDSVQPVVPASLPGSGALMNLATPDGELQASGKATARAANEFTFTAAATEAVVDDKLRSVKHETTASAPCAKLDLPPRGLTY